MLFIRATPRLYIAMGIAMSDHNGIQDVLLLYDYFLQFLVM